MKRKRSTTPPGGHHRIMTPGLHQAAIEYAAAVLVGAHKRTLQRCARTLEREAIKIAKQQPFVPLLFTDGE